MKASQALNKDQQEALAKAVAAAEARTRAEFLCAVATESGRYDRAESIAGALTALLALAGAHIVHTLRAIGTGWWDAQAPGVPIGGQALLVAGGFVLGSFVASHVHGLRALLTSRAEMHAEVDRSAAFVFAKSRAESHRSRAGVLIYASLFERRVVVLAGSEASAALGQAGLDAIRDRAVERLKAGDVAGALTAALQLAADRLATALPPDGRPADQLDNRVQVIHPRP